MRNDWGMRKLQFRVLYRVFFMRVIDLELLSEDADPTRLIGQFATVFASISFFFSLPALLGLLGGGRTTLGAGWVIEHFFLETTMTVAGLMTVLNWDAAFPDRRDVLVLAPLPVRASTLLVAKIAALFAAPGLTTIAFNVFSGVVWPMLFLSRDHGLLGALQAWPAYWMTIMAGGAFFVFSVLAVQGLAANLLPRQIFLRLSAWLQAGAMCLLLSVYFLEPMMESPAGLTAPGNQRMLAWFPSYWFLGLFQQLNGTMHPAMAPLAKRAWVGLACSALGAGAAMLLSYFRMLPKIIEQPDLLPGARGLRWTPHYGSSLGRAITMFSLRSLLRSRQHRMILSFYLGIGLAILVAYLKTPFGGVASDRGEIGIAMLLLSALMMILTILAIRVVASIPIALRANWIIRLTQVRPARDYGRAVRVSWMVLGVAPVMVLLTGIFVAAGVWGASSWWMVAGHLCVMLMLGMVLVEVCVYSFPKIPFACSYLPGKANLHFVFWVALVVLIRLLREGAEYESRVLHQPLRYMLLVCSLVVLAAGARWATEVRAVAGQELVFEEEYEAEVTSLKLNF